jgi:HSP20 family protein
MIMTLVKNNYQPGQRTFNNLFDEFFNEFPVFAEKSGVNFPPVNISETADAYHLELNVPGRNKEDFKVGLENGLLTISYEKKEDVKNEDVKNVRREFSFKSFKRSFSLDEKVDAANIQAKYENGLLKLYLPKKAEIKEAAKQINIQ